MRKLTGISFIVSLGATSIGYLFRNSYEIGLCYFNAESNTYDVSCHVFFSALGSPLLYGMGALSVVFLLLLIFPAAFNAWKNFALWFLPPVIDIFVTYDGPGGGFMDPTPQPEWVYQRLAVIYIAISAIIITVSVVRRKLGKSSAPKQLSKRGKLIFWAAWSCYVLVIIGWHFFD